MAANLKLPLEENKMAVSKGCLQNGVPSRQKVKEGEGKTRWWVKGGKKGERDKMAAGTWRENKMEERERKEMGIGKGRK